jgi:hypothetical protein
MTKREEEEGNRVQEYDYHLQDGFQWKSKERVSGEAGKQSNPWGEEQNAQEGRSQVTICCLFTKCTYSEKAQSP